MRRSAEQAGVPWWTRALEAVASEPIAAAVVLAATLPLAIGAAIIAFARRREPR